MNQHLSSEELLVKIIENDFVAISVDSIRIATAAGLETAN